MPDLPIEIGIGPALVIAEQQSYVLPAKETWRVAWTQFTTELVSGDVTMPVDIARKGARSHVELSFATKPWHEDDLSLDVHGPLDVEGCGDVAASAMEILQPSLELKVGAEAVIVRGALVRQGVCGPETVELSTMPLDCDSRHLERADVAVRFGAGVPYTKFFFSGLRTPDAFAVFSWRDLDVVVGEGPTPHVTFKGKEHGNAWLRISGEIVARRCP